jgi:hypothetical protein
VSRSSTSSFRRVTWHTEAQLHVYSDFYVVVGTVSVCLGYFGTLGTLCYSKIGYVRLG